MSNNGSGKQEIQNNAAMFVEEDAHHQPQSSTGRGMLGLSGQTADHVLFVYIKNMQIITKRQPADI